MTLNWRMWIHEYKVPILINDTDIKEIVVSNKFPFVKKDFKCFICYKDNEKIILLCMYFQKNVYRIDFDVSNVCLF